MGQKAARPSSDVPAGFPLGNEGGHPGKELRPLFEDYFAPGKLDRQGIFDSQKVDALFQAHLTGKVRKTNQLWGLLVFQLWYEKMERRLTG